MLSAAGARSVENLNYVTENKSFIIVCLNIIIWNRVFR